LIRNFDLHFFLSINQTAPSFFPFGLYDVLTPSEDRPVGMIPAIDSVLQLMPISFRASDRSHRHSDWIRGVCATVRLGLIFPISTRSGNRCLLAAGLLFKLF